MAANVPAQRGRGERVGHGSCILAFQDCWDSDRSRASQAFKQKEGHHGCQGPHVGAQARDANRFAACDFTHRSWAAGSARLQTAGMPGAARQANGVLFSRQLAALRQAEPAAGAVASTAPSPPSEVVVQRGDTLTSLVRARWVALGGAREALSAPEAHRWALQVARDNGLSDPDRILVGQHLVVGSPSRPLAQAAAAQARVSLPPSVVRVDVPGPAGNSANPILTQTLNRAVDRGYIARAERGLVSERIEALAGKHGFRPDDFAKAVLMESDGLNPKASNGRCHGIIQFCSGPDRGAASAGYGQRPQEILNLSVLQQLDLVDRYFDDTRLREFRGREGQVRLDDLYLTILTPAARQERSLTAALPIAGPQALDLHVGRERQAPITRSSILAGLNVNARARLGQFMLPELMAR